MEQLTQLLAQLAAKLGTTTEYLWSILLKQAQVVIITRSLLSLILIIGIILSIKLIYKIISESSTEDPDNPTVFTVGLLSTLIFILSISLFFSVEALITTAINPEYWALERVLNILE
ncbi:MAG: hypothetical protein EOL97_15660 [Spirochaetia bacterium]|nr:hypothetical protein [Spirochaetia bacterium]